MSTRISVVESNQTEFRHQLFEVLMTSQNNEQGLKANTLTLNSLASMVTTIMNKLESRTIVSEPNETCNNEDGIPESAPKSTCENQTQSVPTRIGTSNTLPIDVVDDSGARSEDETAPNTFRRSSRSKDAKLKGASMSQESS